MRCLLSILGSYFFSVFCSTVHANVIRRNVRAAITQCKTLFALASAINCPIAYFEKSPSLLVMTRGTPRVSSATLIDAKGGKLTTCGQKPCRDCSQGFRYVCTTGGGTNALAKRAKKNGGSYTVYYKVGSQCVTIPDIGKCKRSVKGLCNQVLH